jgi:xanthine dehydrogenase accessory factor
VSCPLKEAFREGAISLDRSSYVVVMTRGHSLDEDVVRNLEGRSMAYLGVIGSRKKIAAMRKHLEESGVSKAFLDGLFQPIGLPIEAETPEEIAVSILAEIIGIIRGADIATLRNPYRAVRVKNP